MQSPNNNNGTIRIKTLFTYLRRNSEETIRLWLKIENCFGYKGVKPQTGSIRGSTNRIVCHVKFCKSSLKAFSKTAEFLSLNDYTE